jgi:hypothetical protein
MLKYQYCKLQKAFYTLVSETGIIIVSPLADRQVGGQRPIFFPEHISYTHGGILMKLHRNVNQDEKLCRVLEPGLCVKGQGHH